MHGVNGIPVQWGDPSYTMRVILTIWFTYSIEFREEKKKKKNFAQGTVLMSGAEFEQLSKQICSGRREEKYDVHPRLFFLRFFTTSFELHADDRSVHYHHSQGPAPPAPQSISHHRGCVSSFLCLA